MAINVNTVYTTVLTILNKEQRGYLTPFEFNNIANQVQLELFEKFFEDYNQYLRMPKTDVEFASRMDHIIEEFQVFEESGPSVTIPAGGAQTSNIYNQPSDLHRFGSASWSKGVNSPPIEILSNRDYNQIKLSPLTQPTNDFPVAKYQQDKLTVFPNTAPYSSSDVIFNYIRKPILARWGYYAGNIGQFIYDSTVFNDDLLNNNGPLLDFTAFTGAVAGTYTNLAYTTTSTGIGLKIDAVAISATSATFSIATPGTGYSVGDVFNITIGSMGGATAFTIKLTTANFNSGSTYGSTNFEISDSMQTEVILEILKYTGIVIRDPQIIQAASQQLNQEEANSKR
tara:strand:+ start:651 stop:1673 length:1023 start_codon:yes stop_codon:yes gene_type:complete